MDLQLLVFATVVLDFLASLIGFSIAYYARKTVKYGSKHLKHLNAGFTLLSIAMLIELIVFSPSKA